MLWTGKHSLQVFLSSLCQNLLQRIVPHVLLPHTSFPRLDRVSHRSILPRDQGGVSQHGQDARARGAHADGIAGAVFGGVLDEEGKGGDDAAGVAEADDPGGADGALRVVVARKVEVHDVPADDDGSRGKGAHGHEADGQILDGEGVVDGEEDGEPRDDEHGAEEDEGEAETGVIGRVRRDEAEGQCRGDGGHGVQLRLHGGVAERFDYGGCKIGKGCEYR